MAKTKRKDRGTPRDTKRNTRDIGKQKYSNQYLWTWCKSVIHKNAPQGFVLDVADSLRRISRYQSVATLCWLRITKGERGTAAPTQQETDPFLPPSSICSLNAISGIKYSKVIQLCRGGITKWWKHSPPIMSRVRLPDWASNVAWTWACWFVCFFSGYSGFPLFS